MEMNIKLKGHAFFPRHYTLVGRVALIARKRKLNQARSPAPPRIKGAVLTKSTFFLLCPWDPALLLGSLQGFSLFTFLFAY